MNKSDIPSVIAATYNQWLTEQIKKLSVDALVSSEALTCTACVESDSGKYVIEYQRETFRYSPEQAYTFLKFLTNHRDAEN